MREEFLTSPGLVVPRSRSIVFGLTRAEIAGLLDGGIAIEANPASVMACLRGVPRGFRAGAADAVMQAGEVFGAYGCDCGGGGGVVEN